MKTKIYIDTGLEFRKLETIYENIRESNEKAKNIAERTIYVKREKGKIECITTDFIEIGKDVFSTKVSS